MQRYNPFTMVHKALRAMLYDASLTLQQTNFADCAESEIALGKVETALFLFEQHAHHEDTHVLPAIELYEPEIVSNFELEHVTDIELGKRLQTLLNIFRDASESEDRIYCGSAISKAFTEFVIFNLQHMAKEEIQINQALWKHYTDEQIILLNQKLVATIPPDEKALSAKWMMRGVNNVEATNWLKSIKQTAPGLVFESSLTIAESELSEDRFEKVLSAVIETELEPA